MSKLTKEKPVQISALLAYSVMILLGIFWGATIPMIKVATNAGFQPAGMIFWQLVIAVISLGTIMVVRGYRVTFNRGNTIYFLVIGGLGTLLPNYFSYLSYQHLPAGIMGIVIATVPMIAMIIGLVLGTEKFQLTRVIGVLLGISAMVLLAFPETGLPDSNKMIFLLVALIAPICYALEAIYISLRAPKDINAISVLFVASLLSLLISAPVAYFSGQWINLLVPWGQAEWALLGSSVFHALAYSGYIWLIVVAGAVFSSQVGYVVTLSAVFLSVIFLGEVYSSLVWLAMAILLIGFWLVQPRKVN